MGVDGKELNSEQGFPRMSPEMARLLIDWLDAGMPDEAPCRIEEGRDGNGYCYTHQCWHGAGR